MDTLSNSQTISSMSNSSYKDVLTLFAHEKSSTLIEVFPRSGSTVILSNLALSNLNLRTNYKTNNVNLLRPQLTPKKNISSYSSKALLVRSPISRLESFFLTKLVAGEPKSVVAVGSLIHSCLKRYPIPLFKELKGFFSFKSPNDLTKYKLAMNIDSQSLAALLNVKEMIQKLTFKDMLDLFSRYGLPSDSHVYPQFDMKTFRLSQYSALFNLDNFNEFMEWYNITTGDTFSTQFNKTQPNNRLSLTKFDATPCLTVEDLQHYLCDNMTPAPDTLIDHNSLKFIQILFRKDYDMHLLTSAQ